MSLFVNDDKEARTQHPVMNAQGLQRLVVAADGLLALLLSLAEGGPGDRLSALARGSAFEDLAGGRGNLRRRLLTRHGGLTSWLGYGALSACALHIGQGRILYRNRKTPAEKWRKKSTVGGGEC